MSPTDSAVARPRTSDEPSTIVTRPPSTTSAVRGQPPAPGQGAGQPRLQPAVGLLGPQGADGLHDVPRRDDGQVELGDGDEPVHGAGVGDAQGLGQGRVAGHRVEELLGEGAHHPGEQHASGEPAEGGGPVDPDREPDRVAQPRGRRSGPAPPRTSALPRSRRAASRNAAPASARPTTSGMARAHHRWAPNGAAFSAQPSGESQVTQVVVTSPTPRRTYDAARTIRLQV